MLIRRRKSRSGRRLSCIGNGKPGSSRYGRKRYAHRGAGHVENHVKVWFVRIQSGYGEGEKLAGAIVPGRFV